MKTFKFITGLFICTLFLQSGCSSLLGNSQNAITISTDSFSQLDGLYIGLEEIGTLIDPSKPELKWYHLSYLKIEGNSVSLDQRPISIYKKDTAFSTSDGGFYYYSGTLIPTDTTLEINLTESSCDYCGEIMKKNADGTLTRQFRIKRYLGKLTNDGILINGYLFTKTNNNGQLER